MNKMLLTLIAAFSVSSGSYAQVLFSENFELQTPGDQPTGTAVRPNTNTADVFATVVTGATNKAGGGVGNGLQLYDNDGSSAFSFENNFVGSTAEQKSAVHIYYDLAWQSDLGVSNGYGRFSTGLYNESTNATLNDNDNILYEVRWYSDGRFYVRGTGGNSSVSMIEGQGYTVDIFINDDDVNSLSYTEPGGGTVVLAANSFSVYLDSALVRTDLLYTPLSAGNNNLGRMGVDSFGSHVGIDYTVDNFIVTDLSVVPEPAMYSAMFSFLALGIIVLRRKRSLA